MITEHLDADREGISLLQNRSGRRTALGPVKRGLEKEKEYGVMKALGTPGRGLFAVVLQQSIACCLVGFVVGEILAMFAASFVRCRCREITSS